ncbi:MAG: Na/Pi cotransporter family protein [Xanthobacteraceae bacterium]|nr:Na/Pi cotransporter family protein [Xanthobacteraceae bacterium]
MGTIIVLDLMGGVALLLWGLHMVESGILRAFGSQLRQFLGKALNNRFAAFAAGLLMTALLQSSTATGLITASFVAEGLVALVPGLAIMLGANVGTTLIVFVLSFNVAAVAPIFFLIGLIAFRAGGRTRIKDLGRVAIGLGLMLLALHLLFDALAPAENAPAVRVVLEAIANDPVFCILIAAALTCAAHSSIAIVLLVMSLTYSNFITPFAALAFVLGANLGSALNPVLEAGRRNDPTSYRLPVGNLFNRIVGVVLVVPFLHPIAHALSAFEPDAARMTAEFHLLFNAALALIFLGLLDPFAALLRKLFPPRKGTDDPSAPRYLDEGLIEAPSLALGDAARETLRVADLVETMLRDVMRGLLTNDRALVAQVSRQDRAVDKLSEAVKLYVTELTRGGLAERESQRATEIISFAINLEHVGDIIDKNLCQTALRKIKHNLQFSPDGASELEIYHRRVLENFKIALVVFMSGDAAGARKLVTDKTEMRNAELAAAERHLERLREGRPETLETTSLHLSVLRDLKRIHSHICSVAYPVLQNLGEAIPEQAGD